MLLPIIEHFGWRAMFLVLGATGLLIALPIALRFARDDGPLSRSPTGSVSQSAWAAFRLPDYWLALTGGILSNVVLFGLLS